MLREGDGFHGRHGWIGGERILKRVWKVKKGPSSSQNVLWRCFKRGKRVGLSNTMGGLIKPVTHQLSSGPRSNAPKRSITLVLSLGRPPPSFRQLSDNGCTRVDFCGLDSFALGDDTPFPPCSPCYKVAITPLHCIAKNPQTVALFREQRLNLIYCFPGPCLVHFGPRGHFSRFSTFYSQLEDSCSLSSGNLDGIE
jgi:hypothetical protein